MTVKTEPQAADLNPDGKEPRRSRDRPAVEAAWARAHPPMTARSRNPTPTPSIAPGTAWNPPSRDLHLTPDEERVMAEELKQLRDLSKKLDENTIEIAAFGMVSRGKSSVLNALLGRDVFEVGATHGTTVNRSAQRWEQDDGQRSSLVQARLVLVDTPGIDEVGGEVRETLAREVARQADLILFIVSGDMQRREVLALSELRTHQKPIILVFNQIDRYPEADREQIHAKLEDERVRGLIHPEDIVLTAARPDPVRIKIQEPDGTSKLVWERPRRSSSRSRRESLTCSSEKARRSWRSTPCCWPETCTRRSSSRKVRIRDEAANRLIWNFSLAKGAAVGLNPIPVADLAGGVAVDVGMIVSLSKIYGIPLTRTSAMKLMRDMSFALGAMGLVQLATRLAASGVRAAMAGLTIMTGGLAGPLTALGYGAIGLTQAGAAATTSYVIGHGAKTYLRQGCQWGPKGIKTVIHHLVVQAKTDSVIERLREDLKKRLKS